MKSLKPGLYVVGTPIGNIGDLSPRATGTLAAADTVACEDTRSAARLGIRGTVLFAEYSESDVLPGLVARVRNGESVALISDSGMPGISDPGFRLVRACRDEGLPVFIIPGPCAAIAGLVSSGLPTDRFTFCGFFRGEKELRNNNKIRHTMIYYESPDRIMNTIAACARVMPERKVAIVREITKIHEEAIIGYPADLAEIQPPKGEIVLVIGPAPVARISDADISEIVASVAGLPTKEAAAIVADVAGIPKKEAYDKILGKF
jgi:16S rRNA (cytidine1402-2'-O)-methyltransferase